MSPVDEHIMTLRLKYAFGFVSLIDVYAPIDVCKLDVKEAFYAKPSSVVDKCPGETFALYWETSVHYPAEIEMATRWHLAARRLRF